MKGLQMINEYLFLTDEHRQEIEQYKPKGVIIEISNIENTPLWIVAYSLSNENEANAKKLSEIHKHILKFSPLVLSCASSEYYNRRLFPFVNNFERKLRRLLYLATSISGDPKSIECTKSLEIKDFGQIFSEWFIDLGFINKIKSRVNAKDEFNGKDKFSKAELQAYIEAIPEETLWDMTLGSDAAPTLRSRFRYIHNYRNDVMHAHNTIGNEEFGKARALFIKVNKELDDETSKFTAKAKKMTVEEKQSVSDKISSTMAAIDLSPTWSEFLKNTASFTLPYSDTFGKLAIITQPEIKTIEDVSLLSSVANSINGISGISPDTLSAFQNITASPLQSEWSKFSKALNVFPPMLGITKFTEQMSRVEKALQPYSDLQKSIRSITDRLPKDSDLLDKPDDEDRRQKKDTPNE